ncbi:MAG TPA: glycosyltransferase [bacterium]|nr:glycosyltransferase [bacterium]HPN33616.1 glycosyltransferase [bacterium]
MPEKRIGILYLIDTLDQRGGTELNLYRLLAGLDADIFQPLVCPLQPPESIMIQMLREKEIEVLPLCLHSIFSLSAFRWAFHLRNLIRERDIRIVQTIHFGSDIMGALCKRLWNDPFVISSRRDMGFNETTWLHRLLRRCTGKWIDLVLTNSCALRALIEKREKIPQKKIAMIYNGVEIPDPADVRKKTELRSRLGLPADTFVVGCVANIQPIKGFEYLIRAILHLIGKGLDIHLLLIGGIEKRMESAEGYYNSLAAMVRAEGQEGRIHFLGVRTDVGDLLSSLDVFILPSLSEGFSNAILEAMAAGVPVIATAVGGNGEAVIAEETGFLVAPADDDAIAAAVQRLYHSPSLATAMGAAARRRVQERFNENRMVKSMEALYVSHIRPHR